MTDTEKGINELAVQNREILHELSLIEDVLKTLLVNNVLDDAEKFVSTIESSDKVESPDKNVQSEPAESDAAQELADLQAQIDYFENKFRNMIGRKCYIRRECEEFYDENKNLTVLSNNLKKNIFNNHWDFDVLDYDFGMFLISHGSVKLWVSFDMLDIR